MQIKGRNLQQPVADVTFEYEEPEDVKLQEHTVKLSGLVSDPKDRPHRPVLLDSNKECLVGRHSVHLEELHLIGKVLSQNYR